MIRKMMVTVGAALMLALILALPAFGAPSAHHAVFVQTDNASANSIVAFDRSSNGTLTRARDYATGGKGGAAAGAVVDPLASQGSLTIAGGGHVLLAVNAGSDSVSLFRIYHGDRLHLKQVISSGGEFPVSLAAHGNLVYVLNAGGAGSVQGYWLTGNTLRPIAGSNQSLGLSNSTPPNFLASPGQIGFTPDGSRVIVTTKASGSTIEVFDVRASGRLGAPVGTVSATPVPFAFSFDPAGRLVVVEAGTSTVSTYTINADGSLTVIGSAPDGQTAACWITAARGFYFVSNAGSASISTYSVTGSGLPGVVGAPTAAAAGSIDTAASPDQRYLYAEAGGAGQLLVYRIHGDGSLALMQTVTGLPVPYEGIATN
jgi:6-phosphogluconolactonase (cycloisomerase 2 family)